MVRKVKCIRPLAVAVRAPLLPISKQDDQEKIDVGHLNRLPLYEFRSFDQLKKAVHWAFFPSNLSLPLFYWLGTHKEPVFSHALQGLILAWSSYIQLSGLKFLVVADESSDLMRSRTPVGIPVDGLGGRALQQRARLLLEPLNKFMGVPIKFLGLQQWQLDLVCLAPNCLTMALTVQAIVPLEHEWIPYAEKFRREWEGVAVIGCYVGEAGLPNILKMSVFANTAFHFIMLFLCKRPNFSFWAEASELLLLEKATTPYPGIHVVRTLALALVKGPMLWTKVSLLSLMYGKADSATMRTLLMAICLGLYGILPVMPCWVKMITQVANPKSDQHVNICNACREKKRGLFAVFSCFFSLLFAFGAVIAVVLVQLAGVFVCPSHEISIVHGCSASSKFQG